MKEGDIVRGKVTGIKPYGAFVKIDDQYDGLVHISEITDGFVRNIEDFLKTGDEIEVQVLKINEGNKLSLSYKSTRKHKRGKYVDIQLSTGFKPFEKTLPEWIAKYQKGGE
ncbi:MAG TPA: CvfD/Ygs/GSP13 family RNA-binding post-transcriptional regulator [Bacillota bacterium]|nr:CvfD/Ygs/GSP13 family RNA-binding post-transcriptional regulator [Bacillota bacterium]HPF42065.1 CvfD/Ygs/GSP13 family RNA-binding post-transcriptional regulator [Bacillota bacterium]HPJ85787.1 CvfD/Ygs/GSP13 family RNA-binding post-transcriptional regulator [Bacillota bacterium]HPQ61512.1 CvfD/Ygs/GSP13 family RNA-binding post-transcriptional regulator [Bacillota bacterium]HRX92106.1 CvfD/Ygs/GSP13 family RNA-binding post-transcriptional regulator [Candidatus Izemoplasmatales bacterium]